VLIRPIIVNGSSITLPPIQPNIKKFITNNQNKNLNIVRIFGGSFKSSAIDVEKKGIINKINNAKNINKTPPNLLGIDLKIA